MSLGIATLAHLFVDTISSWKYDVAVVLFFRFARLARAFFVFRF